MQFDSEKPDKIEERPGMSPNLQMFAQDCSEEDLRAICEGLFVPQRHHGIDIHRAPCWDVASASISCSGITSAQADT